LAFSPNGRFLASKSPGDAGHLFYASGSAIEIWDTARGKKAGELKVKPECVAFSPDGLHLATSGPHNDILIWEAPKTTPPEKAPDPSAKQRDEWWTALGGDAKGAYEAIGQMVDVPEDAVAFLKEQIPPIASPDPKTVARLILQLDNESFDERSEAHRALEKIGECAADQLAKALESNPSLELSRRLEDLLNKCEAPTAQYLQQHRAVATLEWIGTPEARALLKTLADGAPRARLTIEAGAALKRCKGE
jgi:hypothetical protein